MEKDPVFEGVDMEKAVSQANLYTAYYDRDVIRKYVSYAKRISPYMTDDVKQSIVDKYVSIRDMGKDGKITLTARQLEAMVRLAEASARMRLSQKVEIQDSDRAIRLFEYYLRKIADDGQGGLDFDRWGNSTSHDERNLYTVIKQVIATYEGGAPFKEVVEKVEAMDAWTYDEITRAIDTLNNNSEIYRTASNIIKIMK